MDAGNMLKPMLARGASSASAPRRSTNTASTSRRRCSMPVSSRYRWTSRALRSIISILRGLRERYESTSTARASRTPRSSPPQSFPIATSTALYRTKAIDLIDESAAQLRTELESTPEELEGLERRLMQLEIEREALRKEGSGFEGTPCRAAKGNGRRKRHRDALKAQWDSEKRVINDIQKLREPLEMAGPKWNRLM